MEWIDFKDSLPGAGNYILISNGNTVCEAIVMDSSGDFPKMIGMRYKRQGDDQYEWESARGGQPTHWMPLPNPPEGKSK